MKKYNQLLENKTCLLLLLLFVLMEGPVRFFLQPDPWLLHPTHWYFNQPMRLLLELSIVFMLLILNKLYLAQLLQVPRSHGLLLFIATVASAVIFGVLEFDQLVSSLEGELSTILLWLMTGFCIGLGQELLYRGMLYTSLLKFLSAKQSRILTTIIFVAAPLHSIRLWDLYQQNQLIVVGMLIAIYLGVSILFQWLRDKTGSVIIPGLVHGVGNGITWLAVFS